MRGEHGSACLLSRLHGGEPTDLDVAAFLSLLSRLHGGERGHLIFILAVVLLSRLHGGEHRLRRSADD